MVEEPGENGHFVRVVRNYLDAIDKFVHMWYKFDKPTVEFDDSEQSDMYSRQACYLPKLKKIIINIRNRHINDILRSYCHELIHHIQNTENPKRIRYTSFDLNSIGLLNLESDAYVRGNLLFDRWLKTPIRGPLPKSPLFQTHVS